jgi:hypothetical protein
MGPLGVDRLIRKSSPNLLSQPDGDRNSGHHGADKTVANFVGWSKPEEKTGYSWFDIAVEIEGRIVPRFLFHGGCYINQPDRHVTFELRLGRRRGVKSCLSPELIGDP